MTSTLERVVAGLLTAAVVGLSGWIYSVGTKVAAVEANESHVRESIQVIRDDVREIRDAIRDLRR